mgnify:FL=1
MPMPQRETVVFAFDTLEQRKELMAYVHPKFLLESGLRVVGIAVDNEMKRVSLMEEAVARYSAGHALHEAIEAISQCPDLSQWSWDKFENGDE